MNTKKYNAFSISKVDQSEKNNEHPVDKLNHIINRMQIINSKE